MPNIILLTLLATFPPLAVDMYLPAMPTLQKLWGVPLTTINMSLVLFLVAFSFFLLVHGPLSDRIGRKPVLYGGITLFIIGSLLCAVSPGVYWLLGARMIQGAGAAAASSMSLALSKDLYDGSERQRVLAYVGVLLALFPMLAPMFGSAMLKVASWRWIFVSQALIALVSLYGSIRLAEPEFERTTGGVLAVAKRYKVLLSNKRYMALLTAVSTVIIAHFAFIGGSPDMYISKFGLSEQRFSLYFGFNALCFMTGSFLCTRLTKVFNSMKILYGAFLGVALGGTLMLFTSGSTPELLAGCMGIMTLSMGLSRPIGTSLVLDQVDTDVGAASSVMTFTMFMVGGFAMHAIAMEWNSKQHVLAWFGIVSGFLPFFGVMLFFWIFGKKERE